MLTIQFPLLAVDFIFIWFLLVIMLSAFTSSFKGMRWLTFRVNLVPRHASYILVEVKVGFVFDGALWETFPLAERHYNCLIPPLLGYKWPRSRDEVWKSNIPRTDLAPEKSDQNWMVVRG